MAQQLERVAPPLPGTGMSVYIAWPRERVSRTRTLPCVCGGTVRADRIEPAAGLRAHQRTNVHRAWRVKIGLEAVSAT